MMNPLARRLSSLEKIRKLYAKKRRLRKIFGNLKESPYNMFCGQQICAMRGVNMNKYIDEFSMAKQHIYDAGIALLEMNIVRKDENGKYVLNEKFSDYHDWKQCEGMVKKNCEFLKCIGHPSYI